jgi:hypothetical protein
VHLAPAPALELRPIASIFLAMKLGKIQDQAIQARMALIVGADTFDRLFAGIRFDELDGCLLYVFARGEESAAQIEGKHPLKAAGAVGN